ncbi:MAG TPA: autoinducer binding domain-containing protein [Beijerinckiaceae bacterium]|nr:autoinducer binding domain-containing protein [Beijerinckiaceae bacterium]
MGRSIDEYIERTSRASCVDEVRSLFLSALQARGYENLVYSSTRDGIVAEIVWAEFPEGSVEAYRENRWERIDPVLHFSAKARRPFRWDDVTQAVPLARAQKVFMEECRALGVHSGFTVPFHGPDRQVDIISVSARHKGPETDPARLYALAAQSWLRAVELREPIRLPERTILSARELECLRWVKEGKTNWEIGMILSISEKTVEFHLRKSLHKLGAPNRIMGVVVAIQRGLLPL